MKAKKKNKRKESGKVPVRMCVACRKKASKKEMARFVLDENNKPIFDITGKVSGRGANLCPDMKCFDEAVEKGSFGRVWKVSVDEKDWARVRDDFKKYLDQLEFRGGEEVVTIRVSSKDIEKI